MDSVTTSLITAATSGLTAEAVKEAYNAVKQAVKKKLGISKMIDAFEADPDDRTAWIDDPRGSVRVFRGGSWFNFAWSCRAAFREERARQPLHHPWFPACLAPEVSISPAGNLRCRLGRPESNAMVEEAKVVEKNTVDSGVYNIFKVMPFLQLMWV